MSVEGRDALLDGLGQVFTINGRSLSSGYHGLSHHGNDPKMIKDLVLLDTAHLECFAHFLKTLKAKKTPEGKTLLDDTVVLLGTGMGDAIGSKASRHLLREVGSIIRARCHRQRSGILLGDLITIAQRLGLEIDSFSNANRNMNQILS